MICTRQLLLLLLSFRCLVSGHLSLCLDLFHFFNFSQHPHLAINQGPKQVFHLSSLFRVHVAVPAARVLLRRLHTSTFWGMCASVLRARRDALTPYLYRMSFPTARQTRHLDRWLSPNLRVPSMLSPHIYIAHIFSQYEQDHISVDCLFTKSTNTIFRLVYSRCVHSFSSQLLF